MRIIKFTEAAHKDPLEKFNISSKSMNDILSNLLKYAEHMHNDDEYRTLVHDINKLKEGNWEDVRAWKINSIVNRYNTQLDKINLINNIEDYLTELEDEGWKCNINTFGENIRFIHNGTHPIKKLSTLFTFLNNNHRLGFKLIDIRQSSSNIKVDVKFKLKESGSNIDHELTIDDKIRNIRYDDDDDYGNDTDYD